MDTLQALFDSTAALYERFGVSGTSSAKRRRIFMEEVTELLEASSEFDWYDATGKSSAEVVNEAADVFVTVVGLLLAYRFEGNELDYAIRRVIAKNDAKTHETHELVNGKITRKDDDTIPF